MNVNQLIDMLKKMPQELEVYDSSWELVEYVCTATLNDSDKEIVVII